MDVDDNIVDTANVDIRSTSVDSGSVNIENVIVNVIVNVGKIGVNVRSASVKNEGFKFATEYDKNNKDDDYVSSDEEGFDFVMKMTMNGLIALMVILLSIVSLI
jgi:hypothetical protein